MKKIQPVFNVMLFEYDSVISYDVMPYFIREWKEEKKRKHKIWNLNYNEDDKKIDDTKMPETFEEFKKFILHSSKYMFWSKCEFEIIVSDWPCQKHEKKIDAHYQIEMNIDVITRLFMEFIK